MAPQPSVVFRTGPLTVADYDEAIEFLQEARAQLALGRGYYCPCGDDCCPGDCRHDPLVMARLGAKKMYEYRCWHCGGVFTSENSAEHFGRSEDEIARCLTLETRNLKL